MKKTKAENEMQPISKTLRLTARTFAAKKPQTTKKHSWGGMDDSSACNEKNAQSKRGRVTNGVK